MELVITNSNGVNVVSSRVVAEQLGKEHSDVVKKIKEVLEIGTEYNPVQIQVRGKEATDFLLTKDGFILLSMNYQGYNDFKRAYIAKFNEMEKAEVIVNNKTKLLADLFSDDKMTVVNAHKELIKIETKPLVEKLEYQEPIVKYHDNVLKPKNLISVTDIAKDLGITAVKLNRLLHEAKIQYKQSGTWFLYAEHEKKVPEYADYVISEYGQQLKWSEIGRKWIIEVLKNK
ncbi:MAG: phage regulatory protein/antirepressor Ant [Cetobacterium sp.]